MTSFYVTGLTTIFIVFFHVAQFLNREKRKKKKLQYKEMRLKNIEQGCAVKRFRTEKISTVQNFDSHYHIAIDLSFDRLMTNKDTRKLGKQISWCYKVNRRSSIPVQVALEFICDLNNFGF